MPTLNRKPIAVMIHGPAGVGKTTFAAALHSALATRKVAAHRHAFASMLKQAVSKMEEFAGVKPTKWEDYKAKDAARPLMVELGRHLRRKNVDVFTDFLLGHAVTLAKNAGHEVIIVEDLRYANEYAKFHNVLPVTVPVALTRAGYGPANDEEKASLTELAHLLELQDSDSRVTVPEWKGDKELMAHAGSVADFVEVLVKAQRAANAKEARRA